MPRLGLGLGLDKQRIATSLPKYLTDAGCTMALNVDRQVKALANPNSPLANPLVDITAKGNNATLTNFAGTANDGFTQQAVKAESGDLVGYGNLIPNADTMVGWALNNSTLSASGGILTVTGNGGANQVDAIRVPGMSPSNKRLYRRIRVRVRNAVASSISVFLRDTSGGTIYGSLSKSSPVQDQWYEFDFSTIPVVTATALYLFVRTTYADAATANGKVTEIEKPMLVNLDDNPAVIALEAKLGRQLTVQECDRLFAFTATTGQVYVKTPFFAKLDGVDSYGIMANTADVDILGTNDFAISTVFMTPSALVAGYIISKSTQAVADMQYAIITRGSDSIGVGLYLNGIAINTTNVTLQPNTLYELIVYRLAGVVKIFINDLECVSVANVTSIATQPNTRIGARSSNAGGTTHTSFSNNFIGNLAIFYNGATGLDLVKVEKAIDKFNANYI